MWSVHNNLCCSFILTLFPFSSLGPLHGLQSFMHCSSVSLSMGCRTNPFQHEVSTSCNCFRKSLPALVWGPPQDAVWISAVIWSSPWAAGRYLPPYGLFHRLQGNLYSGARSISSFFSELAVSHTFFLTPQCCVAFCLFLTTFSQTCHCLG